MNNKELTLIYAYLVVQSNHLKEKGFIPTIDLVLEKLAIELKEKEIKV